MNSKRFIPDALWIIMPALIGMVFILYVFYPGYMSNDSVDQLTQGRSNNYTDWHPPLMSWVWGRFDQVLPGPAGMLLFHNLLFWGGLGLFMQSVAPKWPGWLKSILILLVGFFPPILMLLGVIWKDVGMAAAFLFGTALLVQAQERKSAFFLSAGLVSIWYGFSIRLNGIIAAVPLIFFAAAIFYDLGYFAKWKHANKTLQIFLSGVVLLGVMLFATKAVEKVLVKNPPSYPIQQIFIHDLVGISVRLSEVLLPDYLLLPVPPTQMELRRIYTPGTINHLFFGDDGRIRLKLTNDPVLISNLRSTWAKVVLDHPKAYLIHRSRIFYRQYWLEGRRVCFPYQEVTTPNALGVKSPQSPLTASLFAWAEPVTTTFLYRGWIYLLITFLLVLYNFLYALFNRMKLPLPAVILALSTSGLLFGAAYFFISPACDFRFHYWVVISAILSMIATVYFKTHPGNDQQ
ncbi:MAG TPA: hypothetical protein VFQ23_09510 [Anaerolineales bacterium]|nr:hypothetical protein [Anaerolineales bacterium]